VKIYTLGTSTRSLEEFISVLRENGIEVAVDVRRFPRSRFPHFEGEALAHELPKEGIEYVWMGKELGGYRKGGYPAYMETQAFQEGLRRLEDMATKKRVAIFCAERIPWRCHRRFISRRLEERGWEVVHLI